MYIDFDKSEMLRGEHTSYFYEWMKIILLCFLNRVKFHFVLQRNFKLTKLNMFFLLVLNWRNIRTIDLTEKKKYIFLINYAQLWSWSYIYS